MARRSQYAVAKFFVRLRTAGVAAQKVPDRLLRLVAAARWPLVSSAAARQFWRTNMLRPGSAEPQIPTGVQLTETTTALLFQKALEKGARTVFYAPDPIVSVVFIGALCSIGVRALPFLGNVLKELLAKEIIPGTHRAQGRDLIVTTLRQYHPEGTIILRNSGVEQQQAS
ncbi:MAG: hypothetical protein HY696_04985 [Deltaproteobacteria bacterium]|nr:hypothetical protein [Deltaproteobacteria bacterium]